MPPGAASSNIWSAPRRWLKLVVPVTLLIIFLLLYLNFHALTETLIVMLSLPFSLVGGLWWLAFKLSVAVAVGFIALAGVAAETGVVMLIYLDHALAEVKAECAAAQRAFTAADLQRAIMHGAVERVPNATWPPSSVEIHASWTVLPPVTVRTTVMSLILS
jgi:Cu/Ag efflux pump CusA